MECAKCGAKVECYRCEEGRAKLAATTGRHTIRAREALDRAWGGHILAGGWRWVDVTLRVVAGGIVAYIYFTLDMSSIDQAAAVRSDLQTQRRMNELAQSHKANITPEELDTLLSNHDRLIKSAEPLASLIGDLTRDKKALLIGLVVLIVLTTLSHLRTTIAIRRLKKYINVIEQK
jgi:hypothetical protein